jgi:hypothetical protein
MPESLLVQVVVDTAQVQPVPLVGPDPLLFTVRV